MAGLTEQQKQEREALARLRDVAALLSGDVWAIAATGGTTRVLSLRADGTEVPICTLERGAGPEEIRLISAAIPNLLLFLGLFDRAAASVRALKAELAAERAKERPKDYPAQAAMLCQSESFQLFLTERAKIAFGDGDAAQDKDSADRLMKRLIAISSKKDLATDAAAQARFRALRVDFGLFMKGLPA